MAYKKLVKYLGTIVLDSLFIGWGLSLLNSQFALGSLLAIVGILGVLFTLFELLEDCKDTEYRIEDFLEAFPECKNKVDFWQFFGKTDDQINSIIDQVKASKSPEFIGEPLDPLKLLRRKRSRK